MLQIVSGKFFCSEKTYDTLHRGTYYTNYRTVNGSPIPLPVGRLLPSTPLGGSFGTFTYELTERIEWQEPRPGTLISTGGQEFAENAADVIAFALNVLCTTDVDLVRRLSAAPRTQRQHPLRRLFDTEVMAQPDDPARISSLFSSLIGLERGSYENALRAIHRYITAVYRIADDASLAYVLFVMSIESLAQGTKCERPVWDEYDLSKRRRIDDALTGAPPETSDRVRTAVLDIEHVAVSRRFRQFAMAHVAATFFRDEAAGAVAPIGRPDLDQLLKSAYDIRSAFVHRLASIPRELDTFFHQAETTSAEGRLSLTFQGLARLARHIIFQFIERAPKVEREAFNWRSALPNVIQGELAPQYWIGHADGYNGQTARQYLEGFLSQVVSLMRRTPDAKLTDLTAVLDRIEAQPLDNVKASERRSMLTLYALFQCVAPLNYRRAQAEQLLQRYESDFQDPTVEQLAFNLVIEGRFDWSVDQLEELHATYFRERHQRNVLSLGRALEAVFTLRLAREYQILGRYERVRELVSFAVESHPGHAALRNLENTLGAESSAPIEPYDIIFGKAPAASP